MKKKSFLIYLDYEEQFSALSDEEWGRLLHMAFSYMKRGEVPECENRLLYLAFSVMKGAIDRDQEKYEKVCERNRINGAKHRSKSEIES